MFFYCKDVVLPKLFAISQVDEIKSFVKIIFESGEIIVFANRKIVCMISCSFMLV